MILKRILEIMCVSFFLSSCAFSSADLNAKLIDGVRYNLARISFEVPSQMKLASSSFTVNYAEVDEIFWSENKEVSSRDIYWQKLIDEILKKDAPEGKTTRIIEEKQLSETPVWRKALLHHDHRINEDDIRYLILSDYGDMGVLVSIDGSYSKIENIKNAVKVTSEKYSRLSESADHSALENRFYTLNGVIQTGYKYRERLYSRFEGGPLKIKLTVETDVVHKVDEKNLIDHFPRLALIAWFMPGVSIEKIRTKKRVVAGFEGDEVIMRGTEDGDSELSFAWRFNGQKDSETAPEMTIELEADDGHLEEKLAIWDAVLNSMQVIPQE